MRPSGTPRYCARCGTRLASDNAGTACSPCQRAAREAGGQPPQVPPEFWGNPQLRDALIRDRHIGRAVRSYREHPFHGHKPISQSLAAKWLNISQTQLSRIESGRPLNDLDRLVQWAKTLRIPHELLWFSLPGEAITPDQSSSEVSESFSPAHYPNHGKRLIEALDVIGNDNLAGIADSLGDLVNHYAQTICMIPPAEVYEEILSVRSYAGNVAENSRGEAQRTDVMLSAGWLSNLLAVAACDMGDHATARVWCSDAERRSHDARHPELSAWAILTRAMIAYYQGQARQSVSLAAKGQAIAPLGTVIHAKLATHEMRAAAMIGDASRVADARRYAATAIAALPPEAPLNGAFSINLAEDPPYTATSLLFVGQFDEAISATNRVIQQVYNPEKRQRGENPSGYARSLLILGLAQAGTGRIDEAVSSGKTALSGIRPAWPTMVLAGKLDQVLAREHSDSQGTAEYHSAYSEAASRDPLPL